MDEPIASVPQASAGLADNVAGALAYVFTIIPAILFLILEPYNRRPFVRFHAFQCLCLAATGFVLSFVCAILPHRWMVSSRPAGGAHRIRLCNPVHREGVQRCDV